MRQRLSTYFLQQNRNMYLPTYLYLKFLFSIKIIETKHLIKCILISIVIHAYVCIYLINEFKLQGELLIKLIIKERYYSIAFRVSLYKCPDRPVIIYISKCYSAMICREGIYFEIQNGSIYQTGIGSYCKDSYRCSLQRTSHFSMKD